MLELIGAGRGEVVGAELVVELVVELVEVVQVVELVGQC